jgi:hypothetical protein
MDPDIILEFVVTDRIINLVEEGVDLAIHNGELKDSTLIAQIIATTPIITVGSPSYLEAHDEPASPSDLDRHSASSSRHKAHRDPGGSRESSGTSNINRKAAFGPTMRLKFARPCLPILDWRTRPAGFSLPKSLPTRCVSCSATISRRRFRSAQSIPLGGGWRRRFGSLSNF